MANKGGKLSTLQINSYQPARQNRYHSRLLLEYEISNLKKYELPIVNNHVIEIKHQVQPSKTVGSIDSLSESLPAMKSKYVLVVMSVRSSALKTYWISFIKEFHCSEINSDQAARQSGCHSRLLLEYGISNLEKYELPIINTETETETILFPTYKCTNYFYLLIYTFLIYLTCFSDFLIENVEGTKKKPQEGYRSLVPQSFNIQF